MIEVFVLVFTCLVAILPSVLILLLIYEIGKQSSRRPHPATNRRRLTQAIATRPDFTRPHPLKGKLFNLLNGDYRTAERLLAIAVRDCPGKSESWYYDKVIHDLIRDRR